MHGRHGREKHAERTPSNGCHSTPRPSCTALLQSLITIRRHDHHFSRDLDQISAHPRLYIAPAKQTRWHALTGAKNPTQTDHHEARCSASKSDRHSTPRPSFLTILGPNIGAPATVHRAREADSMACAQRSEKPDSKRTTTTHGLSGDN